MDYRLTRNLCSLVSAIATDSGLATSHIIIKTSGKLVSQPPLSMVVLDPRELGRRNNSRLDPAVLKRREDSPSEMGAASIALILAPPGSDVSTTQGDLHRRRLAQWKPGRIISNGDHDRILSTDRLGGPLACDLGGRVQSHPVG